MDTKHSNESHVRIIPCYYERGNCQWDAGNFDSPLTVDTYVTQASTQDWFKKFSAYESLINACDFFSIAQLCDLLSSQSSVRTS